MKKYLILFSNNEPIHFHRGLSYPTTNKLLILLNSSRPFEIADRTKKTLEEKDKSCGICQHFDLFQSDLK